MLPSIGLAAGALALLFTGCSAYHLPATRGVDGRAQAEHGPSLATMRLKPSVCAGVDLHPEYGAVDEQAIVLFLKARGFPVRTERARSDLVYVEMQLNPETDEWVRLRVAILGSAPQAGQELHEAVLQHGTGAWGVHRSNLAVLAPIGEVDDILAFIGKTKLACWGVLTVAGRDDTFVLPGGYREL